MRIAGWIRHPTRDLILFNYLSRGQRIFIWRILCGSCSDNISQVNCVATVSCLGAQWRKKVALGQPVLLSYFIISSTHLTSPQCQLEIIQSWPTGPLLLADYNYYAVWEMSFTALSNWSAVSPKGKDANVLLTIITIIQHSGLCIWQRCKLPQQIIAW